VVFKQKNLQYIVENKLSNTGGLGDLSVSGENQQKRGGKEKNPGDHFVL